MAARAGNMVAAGITTARDLGGGQWLEVELRERIKRGQVIGPRLLCAGQPITSPGGHCYFWGGEAASIDEIKRVIDRQIEHGVDLIKVMATGGTLTPNTDPASAQFDIPTLEAIVSYAARQGCQVAAHCHGTEGIRNASEAGVSTVEHCSWIGPGGWGTGFSADVAARMATQGIWVSTTLNSGWKRFIGDPREALMLTNYAQMRSAGVNLLASTDAGIPNVYHDKLPEALPVFSRFTGLSAIETLKAATSEAARAIGLGDVTGSIKPGLDADLLFVKGDPLTNLNAVCQPVAVLARGVPVLDFPAPVR
jgi:imidazolonepropionase-like amidohydrolase